MTYTIEDIREAGVQAALAHWSLGIRDIQHGYAGDILEIERFFRIVGWQWAIDKVGGTYRETASTMWCGIFVGAMYSLVGDFLEDGVCVDVRLNPEVAKLCMPSCPRLASSSFWKRAGVPPARRLDPADAQRGDIVILDTPRTDRPSGDHVMLALAAPKNGVIRCVEGNAVGELGDGTTGEGVVTNSRPLKDCLHAYRLELHHFVGSALK
tara:strand:- start:371 stop:1000 length:630 start_codon:yes stop_codon:yes gene_type:complete